MILIQIDMHRLYCPSQNILSNTIIIDNKEQVHHARNVLRIKPLELVAVFDNQGNEYIASVIEIGADTVKLEIKEKRPLKDTGIKITIACAIPKKWKMDDIVDKLTQLGVERIIPLLTERVIVKIGAKNAQTKLSRWRKIAQSASEQSQRSDLVIIEPIKSFDEVIALSSGFDLKLIPCLFGSRKSLRDILSSPFVLCHPRESGDLKKMDSRFHGNDVIKKCEAVPKSIMILIGPEGDFTPGEVAKALKAGFLAITLGDRVLRVDTAAIAVVSFIELNEEY